MRFGLNLIALALLCGQSIAQDVVVCGGTPGGIASAIAAARMGSEVTLVE
ncbi:MAG: FAD-dependent oxidoreductase, partial [Verrucomicrobiales bacterium]|nr:FAD-dependent oxidoreductase [Verrucomicrobiales bacterium]